MVVAGEHEWNKIEIVWVGIKRREKNNFHIDNTWKRMQEIAKELGVPVIEFEIYNDMKEETLVKKRIQSLLSSVGSNLSITKNSVDWVDWRELSLRVEDSQFVYTFIFSWNQDIAVEKKEVGTNKLYRFKLLDYLTIRKYIVKSVWNDEKKRNRLLQIDSYFESPEYLRNEN